MNAYNLLKYFVACSGVIAMLYEGLTVYFLAVGGEIIWASPLVPVSEWGKMNMFVPIMTEFILLALIVMTLLGKGEAYK